jgi:hypothetical protein
LIGIDVTGRFECFFEDVWVRFRFFGILGRSVGVRQILDLRNFLVGLELIFFG